MKATRATLKKRRDRLNSLLDDILQLHLKTSQMCRNAPQYSAEFKKYDFEKNFEYKTTLEILKAASWVFWLLARARIKEYERKENHDTDRDR